MEKSLCNRIQGEHHRNRQKQGDPVGEERRCDLCEEVDDLMEVEAR